MTSEEDDEDDLMPERDTSADNNAAAVNDVIKRELEEQEEEVTRLVNEELALSGTDGLDVLKEREESKKEQPAGQAEEDTGDQAYQMYAELLDIVRGADQPEDDVSGTSTEATRNEYVANMPVVEEESEAEYPSFD